MARKPEDRPHDALEIAARLGSTTLPAEPRPQANARVVSLPPRDEDGANKTVAVLPFRNAGPPEDDYLVDGLTDDLIDALSMTPGLRVRPRGVVMQHKGASDPREIGRALGVQVVVEDYVEAEWAKISTLLLSKFAHALLAAAGMYAILHVAFAGAQP